MRLAFYRSDCPSATLLDRAIGVASYYSHVEGVFSDGMCFSASPRDGGTRFKEVDLNPANWEVVDLPLTPEVEGKLRLKCANMPHRKYAYVSALLSVTPVCLPICPSRTFCSKLWTELLIDAGFPLNDPCRYSPKELFDIIVSKKGIECRIE